MDVNSKEKKDKNENNKSVNENKKDVKYRKYLPIGTVVLLKNAKKKLMITGFCPTTNEDNKTVVYDYAGVIYPEGTVSTKQVLVFNHKQIEKIFHMGYYKNDEEKVFKSKLVKKVKQFLNEKK